MKSFTTLAFVASLALASAQVTYINGTFHCAIPDAAYCASDSLSTNIIIRCNGYIGSPGNCNDNLDGEFPHGVSFAPCFQTSDISGDAACTKNCIIYGASGNYNGSSTVLPGCVPETTSTSSISNASSTSHSTTISPIVTPTTTSSTTPITTITYSNTSITTITHSNTSSTKTTPSSTTITYSNTSITTTTPSSTTIIYSNTTITYSNASYPTAPATHNPPTLITSYSSSVSVTHLPVGPSTTSTLTNFKGGAGANRACAGLAVVGIVAAAFL